MIKDFEKKAFTKKETKKKGKLITFYFPDQQKSIKATSLKEAMEKIKSNKKSNKSK